MGPQKKGFCLNAQSYNSLRTISSRFFNFVMDFTPFFQAYRRNVSEHARNYLAGLLMKAPRKNMERISEVVEGGNYADYQHFISDSKWDAKALKDKVAQLVNDLLGGPDAVLCLDESGFTKKGKKSVGVARQYNGRLGKVDNCQVGVFATLCDGKDKSSIVDYRLYLPEEWINDPKRCKAAGIPDKQMIKKTKIDHAYDMIAEAHAKGISFDWVASDAFYGRNLCLQNKIDDLGKKFTADIPANFSVYTKDPRPYMPRRKDKIGPKYKRRRARTKPVCASTILESIEPEKWSTVTVRETTKGILRVNAYAQRIFTWDGNEKHAREWWLVFTHDPKANEKKTFLCNAEASASIQTMVQKHACRFWIERTFQDGKTSAGMADYQVRGWLGWHHHMAMVMLALLFMLKERISNQKSVQLLSCQDIVELLTYYLPRKDTTEEGVFNSMLKRHQQRQQSILSAKKRESLAESILPK